MSPSGPVGYFIIDSLDSLLIANLTSSYQRARDWVIKTVDFSKLDDKFHTFEVRFPLFTFRKRVDWGGRGQEQITIRVLGGLLSAFHLTGQEDFQLLDKAKDLADRLLPAFDTVRFFPVPLSLYQCGLIEIVCVELRQTA